MGKNYNLAQIRRLIIDYSRRHPPAVVPEPHHGPDTSWFALICQECRVVHVVIIHAGGRKHRIDCGLN